MCNETPKKCRRKEKSDINCAVKALVALPTGKVLPARPVAGVVGQVISSIFKIY